VIRSIPCTVIERIVAWAIIPPFAASRTANMGDKESTQKYQLSFLLRIAIPFIIRNLPLALQPALISWTCGCLLRKRSFSKMFLLPLSFDVAQNQEVA
jgi:hypothetical protein